MSCHLLRVLGQPSTYHVWWSREFHFGMQTKWVGGRGPENASEQCVPAVWRLPGGCLLCLAVQLCGAAPLAARARGRSVYSSVLLVCPGRCSCCTEQECRSRRGLASGAGILQGRPAGALPVCASNLPRCFSSKALLSEGPALFVVCRGRGHFVAVHAWGGVVSAAVHFVHVYACMRIPGSLVPEGSVGAAVQCLQPAWRVQGCGFACISRLVSLPGWGSAHLQGLCRIWVRQVWAVVSTAVYRCCGGLVGWLVWVLAVS